MTITYRKSPKGQCYYRLVDNVITAFAIHSHPGKMQLCIEHWHERLHPQDWRDFLLCTEETTEDAFQRFLAQYIKHHEEVLEKVLPNIFPINLSNGR